MHHQQQHLMFSKIDLDACAEQFKWLREAGCQGPAVGGSNSEGHTLDREEFVKLVERALRRLGQMCPHRDHCHSTQEAIERGNLAKSIGVMHYRLHQYTIFF